MIFKDILTPIGESLRLEIEKLFSAALKSQCHPGDLLLLHINGHYNEEVLGFEKKYNPYVLGPGEEGLAENTHYKFIDSYRQNFISALSYDEYLKKLSFSPERKTDIDKLVDFECLTIQMEMLVYLKFWEADIIIKKLFQFTRILSGEPYDWHFKISESNRDKTSYGQRHEIIRKEIRDKLKETSPLLYRLISDTYKTQIRNFIAHSKFAFHGRNIHIYNYIKEDPSSQLKYLSFENWINIFHNTIALHNEYIHLNQIINEYYATLSLANGGLVEVKSFDRSDRSKLINLKFNPKFKDWSFLNNI